MNDAEIQALRANFPVLKHTAYLNTGTYGAVPTPVADAMCEWYRMLEQVGPWAPPAVAKSEEAYEGARNKLAALLGVDASEIGLNRSVTDGANIVAHGLPWQPGDEVIISDREHESGWLPWQVAAKRYGIKVKVIPLLNDERELLKKLDEAITPRTRLVFISHVSCITGLRLNAAAVARLVHERGALLMLDGAHAVGQFPFSVRELGCDFYAGCGHKWLMGPQGTGFVYIAREHLDMVEPAWVGWGARSRECKGPGDARLLWADGAKRYENATRPWPLYAGLGAAIDLIQKVGLENINARVQSLARPFKEALLGLPRIKLLTPLEAERSVGLVALETRGYDHDKLSRRYEERQLLFPYALRDDGTQWMRIAIAYYLRKDELDRALDLLRECAASG